LIFNPLSWKRSGRIEIKLKDLGDRENIEIIDAEGYIIPSQIVVEQKGEKGVLFIAEDVPPVGYKEYRAASEGVPDASERGYNFLLKAEPEILENEFYKVKIDSTSGCLASIYDKSNQREVLDDSKRGNMIQIYEDMPPDAPAGEPAWNIYLGEMTELYTADNVQVIESGPVRATVQIKKRYGNSTFIQDVTLYRNSPFIEFQIRADWHEHYKTAKLAFPVSFSNDWASYEIPYGVMTRKDPSSESATPEEKEKWEVYAQRWIDLQTKAGDYGVSLINDCKYGFDIQGNVMRMTLLRGPRRAYPGFPDEWADQSNDRLVGEHLIKYALYPHTGDWRMARSVQKGYEFNYPLFARIEPAHEGRLSKSSSFVEISPDNVVLTTIKRAEDSEATLFRFYETAGKNSEVKLKLTEKPLEAYFVDLLERDVTKLIVAGKEISIPIKECEIKTLKVIF
jgi:alpha-mannosidase